MLSMTGFGSGEGSAGAVTITVEICGSTSATASCTALRPAW